ncbi:unnamed protein product, partial [Ectocarpus sp. 8 AP-2014]
FLLSIHGLVEEFLWILGTPQVSGVRVDFFFLFSAQIVTKLCPDREFRFDATGRAFFLSKGFCGYDNSAGETECGGSTPVSTPILDKELLSRRKPVPCLNVKSEYFEFYFRRLGRGVGVSEGCFVRVWKLVIQQQVKTMARSLPRGPRMEFTFPTPMDPTVCRLW